jgi:Tfp pilus assembly protein PilF
MTLFSRKPVTAAALLLCLFTPCAPARPQGQAGTIEGTIQDGQKKPVAGAKVWLDDQVQGRTATSVTDLTGHYAFRNLSSSTYMLRVQKAGYREATQGPIALKAGETSTASIQLSEEPAAANTTAKNATPGMEYSDEPNFTVAGVSDPSNVGGHGSNVTLPTKEALAKDTASLAKEGLPNSGPPAPPASLPKIDPGDFAGNLKAGKELLDAGHPIEARAYLEQAAKLKPDDYQASFCLAHAALRSGDAQRAETLGQSLLEQRDSAEVHELLAQAHEAAGQPVLAAKEYQRAADFDPSEAYLFSWGAELLLHHAYEPSAEVFGKAHRLYPKSVRILVGLGAAAYARDLHDQAANWLLQAITLDPSDPRPYEFLGKVQEIAKSEPQDWVDAFERYAKLQPKNARAHYFYAVALEKQHRGQADFAARERELNQAISLNAHFGDAYLRFGLLQAEKREYSAAVASLQKAVEFTPLPDEAHLRLAQVYREMGETEKARAESQLYNEVSTKKKEQLERERRELGQFVYTMQDGSAIINEPATNP